MPSKELEEAKRLMSLSIGSKATSNDRKAFHRQVIRLCALNDMDSKSFFGSMVWRHFKEFDDLQDLAVDAILDLCEDDDEKTRIQGIKGLKTTAKADPRWVKSNTGVLLQLLGSASPEELKQVHIGLCELFQTAPVDCIRAIIDECLDSEEGEGSSRRNTLNFLVNTAAQQRRDILESGNHPKAEEALRSGFNKVLEKKKIGSADTLTILRLTMSLSTISGRNATKRDAGEFAEQMMESLSTTGARGPREDLIRLFGEYMDKNPPLDPREALRSLKKHFDVLAAMALEKNDVAAKRIVDKMEVWAREAIDLWARDRTDEFPQEKIVTSFCKTMVLDILEVVTPKSFKLTQSASVVLEKMLYSVFTLQKWKDNRSSIVPSKDIPDLRELTRYSGSLLTKSSGSDTESLRNIQTISEWLTKTTSGVPDLVPSWQPKPSTSRARPTTPPRRPRSPSPRSAPVEREGRAPRSPSRVAAPPKARSPASVVARVSSPPLSQVTSASVAPAVKHDQAEVIPPKVEASTSVAVEKPLDRPAQKVRTEPISTSEKLPLSKRFSKEPVTATSSTGTNAHNNLGCSKSASGSALQGANASRSQSGTTQISRAGEELFPHLLTPADDTVSSAPIKTPSVTTNGLPPRTSTPSLAERLGVPAQSNGKRSRDGSPHQPQPASSSDTPSRPSLLSRMGPNDDARSSKKPRPNTELGKASLLERMHKNDAALPSTPPITDVAREMAPTPGRSISIRSTAVEPIATGPKTIAIFGRGVQPTPTPTPKSTTDNSYFNIKSHSNGSSSKAETTSTPSAGLAIKAASTTSRKVDDEPIRRKGRGFQAQDNDGDWEMPVARKELVDTPSPRFNPPALGQKIPWNPRKVSGQNGNGKNNGNGNHAAPSSLASRLS